MQTSRLSATLARSLAACGLLAVGALLASCATTPQRNDQLDRARASVRDLEQDPNAQQAAASQLRDARNDLQRANTAWEQHRPPEEVTYLAYLADREARAGEAYADQYRARQALAKGNEERSRILLEARDREVRQARQAAQTAQARASASQQQVQATQNELQQARQQLSDLNARETSRGLELTMASDLLFNTGSATLKPGATLQLNRLADFMRGNPKTRIIVEGYTDSTGTAAFNQQLSAERAQAVATALDSNGIPPDRIQTVGRGQDYPVASNTTPDGRQQNRRVDIVLSDMAGRFAQSATQAPEVR